jgi:Ni/Co efflux regulator RcnB
MPRIKTISMAMLAMTQALWMTAPVMAQMHDEPMRHPPEHRRGESERPGHRMQTTPAPKMLQNRHPMARDGDIRIGGYFQPSHREAALAYYGRPENHGFCPPGLAKRGMGCMPPGQVRRWHMGEPMPRGVVYYDVPRAVVLNLGVPPPGYRYVRVASDILLIAIGSMLVVDVMEDLVR